VIHPLVATTWKWGESVRMPEPITESCTGAEPRQNRAREWALFLRVLRARVFHLLKISRLAIYLLD